MFCLTPSSTVRLSASGFRRDDQLQVGAVGGVGKGQLARLRGQHIARVAAGGSVAEAHFDGVAHALDAGVAHVLVTQVAAHARLQGLDLVVEHCLGVDLQQEVHAAAQVQAQVHRRAPMACIQAGVFFTRLTVTM